jgi:hypothetical protein
MACRHQFWMIGPDGCTPARLKPVERTGGRRPVKFGAVGRQLRLQPVQDIFGQAARIGLGLDHQRRHRTDQHGPGYAALTVPGQVAHHFAATGGVTDVDRILQVEMGRQRRQVVGVVVHIVAVTGLGGTPVAAPVVSDDPIAVLQKEKHLRVPVVGRHRPAVAEHDGLTGTPVLVVDLDAVDGGEWCPWLPSSTGPLARPVQ